MGLNLPPGDVGTVIRQLGDRIAVMERRSWLNWDGAGESAQNFGLTTTGTVKVSDTLQVPEWAGTALVFCWVNATVKNSSAGFDFAYLSAGIESRFGGEQFAGYAVDEWDGLLATAQRVIPNEVETTLGPTVTVQGRMRSNDNTWSAEPANIINVDAFALFKA